MTNAGLPVNPFQQADSPRRSGWGGFFFLPFFPRKGVFSLNGNLSVVFLFKIPYTAFTCWQDGRESHMMRADFQALRMFK